MRRKLYGLWIGIAIITFTLLGCSKADNEAEKEPEHYSVFFDIEFDSNLLLARYGVDFYLDDNKIDYLPHGVPYCKLIENVEEGDHTIKFVKEDDENVTREKEFTVQADCTYKCNIHTNANNIVVSKEECIEAIEGAELVLPDVVGKKIEEAEGVLNESGFVNINCEAVNGDTIFDESNWTVVSQNITAGEVANKASAIILGCKKTSELEAEKKKVEDVIALIDSIGAISTDKEDEIVAVRNEYESLDDYLKNGVTNITTLENAEKVLSKLKISFVNEAIGKIDFENLSAENETEVVEAYEKYNSLSDTEKKEIKNASKLETAVVSVQELASEERVAEVEELIKVFENKKITKEDAENVNAANNAYLALSDDEKKQVENLKTLQDARKTVGEIEKAEEQAKKEKALSKLTKKEDKVSGTTFYLPSTYPKYNDSRCFVLPYIATKGSAKQLHCVINFANPQFLGWTKVIFAIDEKRYEKEYSYFDITRDYGSQGAEYIDLKVLTVDDMKMLGEIAESTETIVRFVGDEYHYDYTIPKSDKKAISDVLDAYVLGFN